MRHRGTLSNSKLKGMLELVVYGNIEKKHNLFFFFLGEIVLSSLYLLGLFQCPHLSTKLNNVPSIYSKCATCLNRLLRSV